VPPPSCRCNARWPLLLPAAPDDTN
jgi:hypothetical protein